MFDNAKENAVKFYDETVKYRDIYFNETCDIISLYINRKKKPVEEDIKTFIRFIDTVRYKPSPHNSLFVLQSFLINVLHINFKSNENQQ